MKHKFEFTHYDGQYKVYKCGCGSVRKIKVQKR